MVYKRVRRSCSHKRDQEQFDRCHKAFAGEKKAEDKGLVNLFYFGCGSLVTTSQDRKTRELLDIDTRKEG